MGWTYSEDRWKELIEKLERSVLPDHVEGVIELLRMLKTEVDCAHKRFEDYEATS